MNPVPCLESFIISQHEKVCSFMIPRFSSFAIRKSFRIEPVAVNVGIELRFITSKGFLGQAQSVHFWCFSGRGFFIDIHDFLIEMGYGLCSVVIIFELMIIIIHF